VIRTSSQNRPRLEYLERRPKTSSNGPAPLLILLHGRGAEAKTIFSIEGLLDPSFHILAFTAPYPSEIGGREWFHPKRDTGNSEIEDTNRFTEPETLLTQAIQGQLDRQAPQSAPMFLWGFSQGAAMALILGLRGKLPISGIVPMSGFLPSPVKHWKAWNRKLDILLVHGSEDEVLSSRSSKDAFEFLRSKNIPAEFHEYKGRHKMTLDSIAFINRWILEHDG